MYVKTSGIEPYLERARAISLGWGEEAANSLGRLTFALDTVNQRGVDRALRGGHVTLLTVNGTDSFGLYKKSKCAEAGNNGRCTNSERNRAKAQAHAAQRTRMRAVLADFGNPGAGSTAEWLCYVDDDSQVNVTNLRTELRRMPSREGAGCSPSCWVGDLQMSPRSGREIYYTAGGWCMERDLAHRINELLHLKTSVFGLY